MTFHVYGISSWIGPKAEIITAAAVFYTGANVFLSQDYCLLFRYSALLNKRLNNLFATNYTKLLLFMFSQIFSSGVFIFAYNTLVPPETFFDPTFEVEKMTALRSHIGEDEFVLLPNTVSPIPRIFMLFALCFFLASEIFR